MRFILARFTPGIERVVHELRLFPVEGKIVEFSHAIGFGPHSDSTGSRYVVVIKRDKT
jgi:hypothetical protein